MRIVALAGVSVSVSLASAVACLASGPQIVRATMYPPPSIRSLPGKIAFAPSVVRHGTVVFKFSNHAGTAYRCEVNLVEKYVRPNQVAGVTVAFKHSGLYNVSCADPTNPEGAGLAGQIKVT